MQYPPYPPYPLYPPYPPYPSYPPGSYNAPYPQKTSRMVARGNDPWISVSLLSEHTYCPRAGIIQHESPEEDTCDRFQLFHLGRRKRTFYDLRQMRRALKRLFGLFVLLAVAACIFYIVANIQYNDAAQKLLSTGQKPPLTTAMWVLALLSLATAFIALICLLRWIEVFLLHYLPARFAGSSVPHPQHQESQKIKWWKFINAGFQLINPQEQYRDAEWHLVGCPWRILVMGDMRIPVFKKRPSRGIGGDQLHRQHYARMAAYCHLIEKCEGAYSPYGIVLFSNSYKGCTVPYQPGSKKTFHDGLVGARQTIKQLERFIPAIPASQQLCLLCPHSRRNPLTGASACGERFSWTPPNARDRF